MEYRYRSPLEFGYYENSQESTFPRNSQVMPYRPRPHPYSRNVTENTFHPNRTSTFVQPKYNGRFRLSSYPKVLNDQFGASECNLCGVELPSPIVAKMHYSGKQHMKKVKNFLVDWCQKTGNQMPNISELQTHSSNTVLPDYCEICDVRLTSTNDKLLHFSGKNHRKNEKDPANAKKKKKTYEVIDLSGLDSRFGIGTNFTSKMVAVKEEATDENSCSKDLSCEMCGVKAVSYDQLQMHLNGKKHKERLEKKNALVPKPDRPYKCELCDVSLDTHHQYNLHVNGKRHQKNVQMGSEIPKDFNCDICNLQFPSHDQFMIHYQGKKHEKKARQVSLIPQLGGANVIAACENCPYIGKLDDHMCSESFADSTPSTSTKKLICIPCNNMAFESEQQLLEHQSSQSHAISMLNFERGDKLVDELRHWYCFVCKKQYRNHKEFTQHYFEERHKTLSEKGAADVVSKTDLFHCTECDILMDQETKDNHLRDKKHVKLSAKNDMMKSLMELANKDLTTNTFHCNTCNKILFSFVAFSDHLTGDEHLDRMVELRLMQVNGRQICQ